MEVYFDSKNVHCEKQSVLKTLGDARKTKLWVFKSNSSVGRSNSILKYTHVMTEAVMWSKEEEELKDCCSVFHKEIQIARFKCLTCIQ